MTGCNGTIIGQDLIKVFFDKFGEQRSHLIIFSVVVVVVLIVVLFLAGFIGNIVGRCKKWTRKLPKKGYKLLNFTKKDTLRSGNTVFTIGDYGGGADNS